MKHGSVGFYVPAVGFTFYVAGRTPVHRRDAVILAHLQTVRLVYATEGFVTDPDQSAEDPVALAQYASKIRLTRIGYQSFE